MNMKTDFNTLAHSLINDTFADIAQTLTIKTDLSVYDEDSGEALDFDNPGTDVQAIIGPFDNSKYEASDYQVNDLQAIVPVTATDAELFLQSDTFVVDAIDYTAVNIVKDASESIYRIQLRK